MGQNKTDIRKILYRFIQWGSLIAFIFGSVLILVESAMAGAESSAQSNVIANAIHERMAESHDKKTIKDIQDFSFAFEAKESYLPEDKLPYSVTYSPEDTTYRNLTFDISDENVLAIDFIDSKIQFLNPGTCDLIVSSEQKPNLKKSFHFVVSEILASDVRLNVSSLTLDIGETFAIQATVLPENASDKTLLYSSDQEEVANVSKEGIITAKKIGTTQVKITPKGNPSIQKEIQVTVKEASVEFVDVSSVSFPSAKTSTYPSKDTVVQLSYGPNDSVFDLSYLTIDSADSKLTVKKKRVNPASQKITLTLNYSDSTISSLKSIVLTATYQVNDSATLKASTTIDVQPLKNLVYADIDSSSLSTDYSGFIYENSYYQSAEENTYDEISISLPYKSSIKNNIAAYHKDTYSVSVSSTLSIVSESYNKIVVRPFSVSGACSGDVTFYVNKSDTQYFTFHVSYSLKSSSSHITGIEMEKVYTTSEGKTNRLFLNQEYEDLFSYSLLSSDNSTEFASSGVNCEILEGEDLVEPIYNNRELTGIKTGSQSGELKIKFTSAYEAKQSTIKDPVSVIFSIQIEDFASQYAIQMDGNEVDSSSIEIKKKSQHSIHLTLKGMTSLKDGTSLSEEYLDSYQAISSNEDVLLYDKEAKSFVGKAQGTATLTFTPSIHLIGMDNSITLNVKVSYVAPVASEFSLNFTILSHPNANSPQTSSKVAIGTVLQATGKVNSDASYSDGKYTSSDDSILKVDPDTGEVTALKTGKAAIRYSSLDDSSQYIEKSIQVVDTICEFTLDLSKTQALETLEKSDPDTGITYPSIRIEYGKSCSLGISLTQNSTCKTMTFENVDFNGNATQKNAVIDSSGNIMTKGVGTTIVQITYGSEEDSVRQYRKYLEIQVDRNLKYTLNELSKIVRKSLGHYSLFLVVAACGCLFVFLTFKKRKWLWLSFGILAVIGFSLAGFSELIQFYTPGRSCAWSDVGIDFAGFATSLWLSALIYFLVSVIQKLKKKNKPKNDPPTDS